MKSVLSPTLFCEDSMLVSPLVALGLAPVGLGAVRVSFGTGFGPAANVAASAKLVSAESAI